ncbi:hypothetical protein BM221_010746 [Beauveria bassiana]|uniref:Uncharacterized protein n=1 Tax=Beauveria bassiana TaxID=176275 RepID=A0A2N6N7Y2_BEABA|nr:hypothetical protein BM221_010746 [Beauveria bassiana]
MSPSWRPNERNLYSTPTATALPPLSVPMIEFKHREGSISLGAAYNDATSTVWAVVTAVPDHEDVAEKGLC